VNTNKHPDEFKCFQLILTRFQLATHFFISKKNILQNLLTLHWF